MFSLLLSIYLGVDLLGHRVTVCLIFWGTPRLPKQLYHFTFPPSLYEGSIFSTSFWELVNLCLSDSSQPSGCEVQSGFTLWFWFAFPQWLVMLSTFSCAYWPFVYLLWRNVYEDSLPILKLVYFSFYYLVSCKSYLYSLDSRILIRY